MAEEGDFSDEATSEEVVLTVSEDEAEICDEIIESEELESEEIQETSEAEVEEILEESTKQATEEETTLSADTPKEKSSTVQPETKTTVSEPKKNKAVKVKNTEDVIADGIYIPDNFGVSGGTGKVTITCPNVKVKGDTATAKIVFGSEYYTSLKSAGVTYNGIIDKTAGTATYYVPVEINKDYVITGTTTRMSEPHDIDYTINITVSSQSQTTTDSGYGQDIEEPEDDAIANGRYIPDDWSIRMASGRELKNPIDCTYVKISGEKAYAQIVFHSDGFPRLTSNDVEYKSVVDSTAETSTFFIPVEINQEYSISAFSTKMNTNITYIMNITLSKDSSKYEGTLNDSDVDNDEPIIDDPSKPGENDPANPGPGKDDPADPTKPVKPAKPEKLADGTYQIKADTDNRMFYLVPKDDPTAYRATLVKKNGKLKVTITLSGTGYDYLYLGTVTKAEKADKTTWTKYKESKGYYSYTFEIPALDKELTISAHSEKYDKWYEHKIIFYSGNAKKVKEGTSTVPDKPKKDNDKKDKDKDNNTSGTQTEFKNDKKKDKVSKSEGDKEKSTSVVNSSTKLADGVYTPDKFSWSGGSGRLAYIRCDKITVTDGQAYATIVFSSPSYDMLKANGRVYYNSGSEFSTFVIPVELNANNKIVGRTTAMSAPHWIEYSIFIYSNAAAKAKGDKEITGDSIKASKLSEKAPEIAGLETKKSTKIKYAKNFKVFNYDEGVVLLQIDINNKSSLKYKTVDKNVEDKVEYDDEGKPIAKSQGEITNEMYHANVINYLIVPEGVEIPAGLDKECIIINAPVQKSQISTEEVMDFMEQLGASKYIKATGIEAKEIEIKSIKEGLEKEKIFYAGEYAKPDYKKIIKENIDLNILPGTAIPEKIKKKDDKGKDLSEDQIKEQKDASKKAKATLELIEKRYSTLGVPVIIDRSVSEKTDIAKAEWIKVYGAIFGCQKEAKKLFEEYEKKYKEENNEQ